MALQLDSNIEYKICCPGEFETKRGSETVAEKIIAKVDETTDIREKSLYEQFSAVTLAENSFCSRNFPQQAKHFSEMPIEVVMYILKWVVSDQLDLRSLEIFSSVIHYSPIYLLYNKFGDNNYIFHFI